MSIVTILLDLMWAVHVNSRGFVVSVSTWYQSYFSRESSEECIHDVRIEEYVYVFTVAMAMLSCADILLVVAGGAGGGDERTGTCSALTCPGSNLCKTQLLVELPLICRLNYR